MKKVLVINGVNLNMLGTREPELYGELSYAALKKFIKRSAAELGVKVCVKQSNCEGRLVDFIQKAYGRYDGVVINAGAYTHTSIAILDALKAVNIPTVEVHLTDVDAREEFRRTSYVGLFAQKRIAGRGFEGYKEALAYLAHRES